MKNICFVLMLFALSATQFGCSNSGCKPLPILGERDVQNGDTVYHTIPNFSFFNQDSLEVTNATFDNKLYVADFFFISCPTICPKVKKEMLRVYARFENEPRLSFLSHSIDVRHDTIPRLKAFSEKLSVDGTKWHFVTGEEEAIFGIADKYFSIAKADATAPGGFDHSGRLILVDTKGQVRSFCDGTDPASVDQFMKDIDCLLVQEFPSVEN